MRLDEHANSSAPRRSWNLEWNENVLISLIVIKILIHTALMQVALQRKRLCLDRSSEASGFIVGEQLNMTMNKFSLQILGSLGNSRRARRVQATWRFCNASAEVVTGKYQDFLCNKVYEELESLTTLNFGSENSADEINAEQHALLFSLFRTSIVVSTFYSSTVAWKQVSVGQCVLREKWARICNQYTMHKNAKSAN